MPAEVPPVLAGLLAEIQFPPERWDPAEFQQITAELPLRNVRRVGAASVGRAPGDPCPVPSLPADATAPAGSAASNQSHPQ